MRPSGRCRVASVVLIAIGMLSGGCVAPTEGAAITPPPQIRPEPGGTYLAVGNRLLAAQEPALAMKAYLASIGVEGMSFAAFTGAGVAAYRQGLLTQSQRYFERASRLAPDSVVGPNNLGVVLFKLKEYYPASNSFRAAVALSSGESETALGNLNRVEAVIAVIEEGPDPNPALSHEVVRLGSSEFQLIESEPQHADDTAE